MDESVEALTRLIEYALREAHEQGLRHTGYFLELARESLDESKRPRPGDSLGPALPVVGDRGTGLQ